MYTLMSSRSLFYAPVNGEFFAGAEPAMTFPSIGAALLYRETEVRPNYRQGLHVGELKDSTVRFMPNMYVVVPGYGGRTTRTNWQRAYGH